MTSFGLHDVLKCDTDEPLSTGLGAYISTWPLACRPAVRMPLFATTVAPTQCRSPVSIADAARCASLMADQRSPELWSSRFRMYVSSSPARRVPSVSSTKVRNPSPWPISWRTTATKSMRPPGGFPSRP
jgi:hypothetical protein